MNAEQVQRKWMQFKSKLKQHGRKCIENDLQQMQQTEEKNDKIIGIFGDRNVIYNNPTCLTTILNGPGELIGPRHGQRILPLRPAEAP
jgi:hypothetical protein